MNGPDQFPHLLPMIAMAVAFVAESSPAFSQSLTFAAEPTGTLSKTFETALTGQGQAGRWEVIEDASADDGRALAQLNSDPTDYRFPPAIPRAGKVGLWTKADSVTHFGWIEISVLP